MSSVSRLVSIMHSVSRLVSIMNSVSIRSDCAPPFITLTLPRFDAGHAQGLACVDSDLSSAFFVSRP